MLVTFGDDALLLFELLAVALYVFDHKVFSGELVVVGEVVEELQLSETLPRLRVKYLLYRPHRCPKNVPIIIKRRLLPPSLFKISIDHIFFKIGFPLNFVRSHFKLFLGGATQ